MNEQDYINIFYRLWEHAENEVVEFKRAENSYDIDDLGKYFSALNGLIRSDGRVWYITEKGESDIRS